MRCDVCGKRMLRGGGIKIYENDVVIGNYHRHCYGNSCFAKMRSEPLNVDKGRMNANELTTTDLRKDKQ